MNILARATIAAATLLVSTLLAGSGGERADDNYFPLQRSRASP